MKKKRVLKSWVVKVLGWVLGSWFFFVCTTIDNVLENRMYDIVLVVWTLLAIGSFYLLENYSDALEYKE
jgi:hypothetical protein